MTRVRTWTAAFLLVGMLAACGGSENASTVTSGAGETSGGATPASVSPSTAGAPSAGGGSGGGGKFCDALREQQVTLAKVIPAALSGTINPALLNQVESENKAIVSLAPQALRSDMDQILKLTNAIIATFRAGTVTRGLPPETQSQLASPEYAAASGRVLTYMTDVCKIDVTKLGP